MAKNNSNPAVQVGSEPVIIPEMPEKTFFVDIEGPMMLQNKLTDEAKDVIKGNRKAGAKKDLSLKKGKWEETLHYTKDHKHIGFPTEAFMKAMGTSIKGVDLKNKKLFKYPQDLYREMHIHADDMDQDDAGIVRFTSCEKPVCQEHWAVIQGKTPIPIYRALVNNWKATLKITYNSSVLDHNDILMLVNKAGRSVGIGAYRIEKRGEYGRFRVTQAAFQVLKDAA